MVERMGDFLRYDALEEDQEVGRILSISYVKVEDLKEGRTDLLKRSQLVPVIQISVCELDEV